MQGDTIAWRQPDCSRIFTSNQLSSIPWTTLWFMGTAVMWGSANCSPALYGVSLYGIHGITYTQRAVIKYNCIYIARLSTYIRYVYIYIYVTLSYVYIYKSIIEPQLLHCVAGTRQSALWRVSHEIVATAQNAFGSVCGGESWIITPSSNHGKSKALYIGQIYVCYIYI